MSDTFQRVFDNAAEVALLERATIICNIESSLPDNRKRKFLRWLHELNILYFGNKRNIADRCPVDGL